MKDFWRYQIIYTVWMNWYLRQTQMLYAKIVEPQEEEKIISDTSDEIKYESMWHSYPQPDWEGGSEHYTKRPGKIHCIV